MPNDMKKKEFDVQKKGGAISPQPNKLGSGSPCPIQMREIKQKKECGMCRYYDKSICQKEGVETTTDSWCTYGWRKKKAEAKDSVLAHHQPCR